MARFQKQVVEQNERPAVPKAWAPELGALVVACWAPEPAARATMVHVAGDLVRIHRTSADAVAAARAPPEAKRGSNELLRDPALGEPFLVSGACCLVS
jgi:hypothetical protein